jgi:simple sugar transport system substrate-binding protein
VSDHGKRDRFGERSATPRFFSVTHDILGDPFWAVYRRGLSDATEHLRCRVDHLAPATFSPPGMVRLLAEAIDARPDGMLATVPDHQVVESELRRAIALDIPVIAVNAPDPRDASSRIPYAHYIGASDERAGAEVARRQLLDGEPKRALCLDHYLTDNICHQARCSGYLGVMREAGVPADRLRVPGDDPAPSLAHARAALREGPLPVAVCTLGPPGSAAVATAIEAERLQGQVQHASFDLAPAQLEAIRAGRLDFSVDSQQYLQGYLGVVALHLKATKGYELAGDVLTGPAFVDRSNCDQVAEGIRSGFR